MMRSIRFFAGISAVLLMGGAPRSAISQESGLQPSKKASRSEELLLSSVVNGGITGLSSLDSESLSSFEALADRFLGFKRGSLGAVERQAHIQSCETPTVGNPFCRDRSIQEVIEETEPGSSESLKASYSNFNVERAFRAVLEVRAGDLAGISEGELSRALRKVRSQEELSPIAEVILKASACKFFPLNVVLAMKMEEYFPEPSSRQLAMKLYEQGGSCDSRSSWVSRAQYRVSLLWIAEGQWAKAQKWLESLSKDKTTDYYSRSLYWRARAASALGDLLGFEQAKSALTRDFPIHYHSLLLSGKKVFNSALNLHLPEPVVHLESRSLGAKWNDRVRAIEILQKKKAHNYTKIIFDSLERMMPQAEPEARLYLTVLYVRNANAIGAFRALSSLIRDHPAILSRQTLSLLFPLTKEHRHILYTFAGGGLDPYLIAALIRQESGFVSSARSPAGAMGLMQLMPGTARRIEKIRKNELFDSRTNVRLGVRYFRELIARFSGKVDLALAAYNAGPERVVDWQKRYQVHDPVLLVDLIPFRETREYVSLISRNYYWYLQLYARHIFDQRFEEHIQLSKSQRSPSSTIQNGRDGLSSNGNFKLEFSLFSAH